MTGASRSCRSSASATGCRRRSCTSTRSGTAAEALSAVGVRHSQNLSAAAIELEFDEQPGQPLAAQLDGEEFPATPRVRIDVAPRALRLVVPAEHATDGGGPDARG